MIEMMIILTNKRKKGRIRVKTGVSKIFPNFKTPLVPRNMTPAIKTPKDSTWG
jgi:hypothetical protein